MRQGVAQDRRRIGDGISLGQGRPGAGGGQQQGQQQPDRSKQTAGQLAAGQRAAGQRASWAGWLRLFSVHGKLLQGKSHCSIQPVQRHGATTLIGRMMPQLILPGGHAPGAPPVASSTIPRDPDPPE